MATPSTKPFRMAPLQRLTVKPVEDPAEQAAIDERLKRGEKAVSADSTSGSGIPGSPAGGETSAGQTDEFSQGSDSEPLTPKRRSTRKRR